MKSILATAALACLPLTATAAELVVRDLNVSLSVLPTAFSYTLTSPTVSSSGEDAFVSGTELTCGTRVALARPGDALGLVVGADLISDTWTYGTSGYLFAGALRASAGLGWAISDNWMLLVEPGLRYGLSTFSSPESATSAAYKATGTCSGFDGRISVLWQLSKDFLLEAHGGYMALSHSATGDDIDLTIEQSGLYVGVGVVWRWSTAPTRIE